MIESGDIGKNQTLDAVFTEFIDFPLRSSEKFLSSVCVIQSSCPFWPKHYSHWTVTCDNWTNSTIVGSTTTVRLRTIPLEQKLAQQFG